MNPNLRTFDAATSEPVLVVSTQPTPPQITIVPTPSQTTVQTMASLPLSPLVQGVQGKGEVLTEQQKSDEQKKKVYMYVGFGVGALALIFVLYKIFKK